MANEPEARVQDLPEISELQDADNSVWEHNGHAHRLTAAKLIRYLITACDKLGVLGIHVGSNKPAAPQNVWFDMKNGSPILSLRNMDTGFFESIPVVHDKTTEEDFKKWNLDVNHPIGSLYWSKNPTDPGTFLGGTWTPITDKFILAAGTHPVDETGGEEEVSLTNEQLPLLSGNFSPHWALEATPFASANGVFKAHNINKNKYRDGGSVNDGASSVGTIDFEIGGNKPHENMPPYITRYCWERTA